MTNSDTKSLDAVVAVRLRQPIKRSWDKNASESDDPVWLPYASQRLRIEVVRVYSRTIVTMNHSSESSLCE